MLKRESAIVVFTTAFISFAVFGRDVCGHMVVGEWEAIMGGITNSIIGIVIALLGVRITKFLKRTCIRF